MGFINRIIKGFEPYAVKGLGLARGSENLASMAGSLLSRGTEGVSRGVAAVGGPFFGAIGRNLLAPALGGVAGGIHGGVTSENQSSTGVFRDVIAGAAGGVGIGLLGSKAFWKGMKGAGRGLGNAVLRPYGKQLNRAVMEPSVGISKGYMGELTEGLVKGTVRRSDFALNATWRRAISASPASKAGAAYRAYAQPAGRMALNTAKTVGGVAAGAGVFAMQHPVLSLALGGGTYGALSLAGAARTTVTPEDQERRLMEAGTPSTSMESRQRLENSTMGLVQGLHRSRHGRG